MLNRKTILALAAVLIVLVGLNWATSRRYEATTGGGVEELLASPIDTGAVQTIRAWLASAPEEVVELARRGDEWVVASQWGWAAKQPQIDRLLEDFGNLRGELRSSKEELLPDFQAGDEKGLHLVGLGSGGSELFHLVVGKTALRGGTFVRQASSNDVFLTPSALRSSFGVFGDEPEPPSSARWVELRVHQADRNDVDRVELTDGGTTTVLEKVFAAAPDDTTAVDRNAYTWKPDGRGEFDKAKTDGVLSTLTNLYASDALDPATLGDSGLDAPARTATLYFADGTVTTMNFGAVREEDSKVYFQLADALPGLIHKATVDRIFQDRAELSPAES